MTMGSALFERRIFVSVWKAVLPSRLPRTFLREWIPLEPVAQTTRIGRGEVQHP
jgi:hypothetical protein